MIHCRSTADLKTKFTELTKFLRPAVVFEIGAREAEYSKDIGRALSDSKVVAFEAYPFNYDLFREGVVSASPNIQYLNLAVSDSNQSVTFYVNKFIDDKAVAENTGRNSIIERNGNAVAEGVDVGATTIDSFREQHGLDGRYTAWIDVEGAQAKVLRGMSMSIVDCCALHIEVEEHEYWQGQWLADDVTKFLEMCGMIPVARDFESKFQHNRVYVNKTVYALHSHKIDTIFKS